MGTITMKDIGKAAYTWIDTETRPTIKLEPGSDKNLDFIFPDTPAVRKAIQNYIQDEKGFKRFFECYKNLRQELYMKKGMNNANGNSKY